MKKSAVTHAGAPYSIRNALRAAFNDHHGPRCSRCQPQRLLLPLPQLLPAAASQRRAFHDFFVTHLPSSSLSPDKPRPGLHHRLPRQESQPHAGPSSRSAADISQPSNPSAAASSRDTTIVRIPIKSAKHHFGAGASRGTRPRNEDTYQAGTIDIPALAPRQPVSISRRLPDDGGARPAKAESGDPQVFYFSVFDGHGGSECSAFLRDRLHGYIEQSAVLFGLESSLRPGVSAQPHEGNESEDNAGPQDPEQLQKNLVSSWRDTVGGYFRRFKPEYFPALREQSQANGVNHSSIETVLSYAFLKADLDFTAAQAAKQSEKEDDPVLTDKPLNDNDVLFQPDRPASQNLRHRRPSSSPNLSAPIGGNTRFKGGSTASIALISTPSSMPFWHPGSPCTIIVAHVGDTRILLCRTDNGKAEPLTINHHPSAPVEAQRLRRYAQSFVTDSFGEERVQGLANTRAFGDISSKRIGVSAEPQITRVDISPAQFSFMVLVSDGISGALNDQEIVDVVKEAKTPALAADALVNFAVEVDENGDNCTALVVRLGGWERRSEGGQGSLGTQESRRWRKNEAMNPRSRRQ